VVSFALESLGTAGLVNRPRTRVMIVGGAEDGDADDRVGPQLPPIKSSGLRVERQQSVPVTQSPTQ
jgi:hypothetical protein